MAYRGSLAALSGLRNGQTVEVNTGGGLSCIWGLGVKVGLMRAGFAQPKEIGGVSAGAFNAAASRSARDVEEMEKFHNIYVHMARRGHFKVRYTWYGRPYLHFNVDELIACFEGKFSSSDIPPIDIDRIRDDTVPFWVIVTHAKRKIARVKDARTHLFAALKATSSVPGACKPVLIGDEEFCDGAWRKPLPAAAMRGAQKVLVIMSQPPPDETTRWGTFVDYVGTHIANADVPRELREATWKMNHRIAASLRLMQKYRKTETLIVYPSPRDRISQVTSSVKELRGAFERGIAEAERLISLSTLI